MLPSFLIIAGGYRTGSTLQYNLFSSYLELTGQGGRVGFGNMGDVWRVHTGVSVVKSHNLGGWEQLVMVGEAFALSSVRDVTAQRESICRKFSIDPQDLDGSWEWRLTRLNEDLWKRVGTLEQRYDNLVHAPVEMLFEGITAMGLVWDEGVAEFAAASSSRNMAMKVAEGLTERGWDIDPDTLIHHDHISS